MRITINIVDSVARIVIDDDCEAEVHRHPDRLDRILQEMKSMTEAVDRLKADITSLTTVEQSAVQLLAGLSQTIRDNAGDPVALNAIADDLEARTADLAAAVTANTPASAPPAGGATVATDTGATDTGTGTTGADAGAVAGDGGTVDSGNASDTAGGDTSGAAAPAGATDGSGTAAIDPTVTPAAGEQATQDQANPPA